MLRLADEENDKINLALPRFTSLDNADFITYELQSHTNWNQILYEDDVLSILQYGSNLYCTKKLPKSSASS